MTSEVMEISESRRMIRPVQALETRAPLAAHPPSHVGTLLREWRTTRRLSQLELALEANVSSRHLSCVETGKAQPSRDMICDWPTRSKCRYASAMLCWSRRGLRRAIARPS